MSSDHACLVLRHAHASDRSWTIMGMWWAQMSNTPLSRQQQLYIGGVFFPVLNVATMLLCCFSFILIVAIYSESKTVGHDGLTVIQKCVHRHTYTVGVFCLFFLFFSFFVLWSFKNRFYNKTEKQPKKIVSKKQVFLPMPLFFLESCAAGHLF